MARRRSVGSAFWALVLLSLGVATPSGAEQDWGPIIASGELEAGYRGVWGDTNSAKFEEYRDIREGGIGAFRFLLEDEERRYYLWARGDDLAESDQGYAFEAGRYGRWGLRGGYSEIPHVFSKQAVTPYERSMANVLTLPPGFDRTLGPGAAYDAQLLAFSEPTPLRFSKIVGYGEIFARPTPELQFDAGYRIIDKDGTRALGMAFGSPGGSFVNYAAPISERTHEATASANYVRENWNVGLEYVGSFFENDFSSVSVDNPLQAAFSDPPPPPTSPTDVGRLSLPPENSAHLVTLSGGGVLPMGFPARLAGSFTWGVHIQDNDFIPFTSNASLPGSAEDLACVPPAPCLTLPQNSLDGWVQTLNGNLVFTARPLPAWNVKARYRIYDYDNQTDPVLFTTEVINDQDIEIVERRSIANSYRRQNAVLESTHRLAESTRATLGFGWENWLRSRDREVRHFNSYGPTARIDWQATSWARLRASYAFTAGRGDEYNPFAPFAQGFPADDPEEVGREHNMPNLRKFSEADYLRNRFRLLGQVSPCENLDLTLQTGFALTNYDHSELGLTEDNRFNVGLDASYQIHPRVGLSAFYTYDYIWAYQKSVNRPFPTGDPTGEWNSTTFDYAHNAGAEVDATLVEDLLDGSVSYFFQYGNAKTRAGGDPAANPTTWPALEDRLQAVNVALDLSPFEKLGIEHPFEKITLRGVYRYEQYNREFFTEDFPVSDAQGDIYLQNAIGDYDAHIFTMLAIVKF